MILLDKKRIERTLKRMNYQILEKAQDSSIRLIGLNERGLAIAEQIRANLESATNKQIPVHQLESDETSTFDFTEKPGKNEILVIIDDVVFSGASMFRSIYKIPELFAFKKVLVAVLVDRGHRKLPVHAGIVGLYVPTKLNEHVELRLDQHQPNEVVLLDHQP